MEGLFFFTRPTSVAPISPLEIISALLVSVLIIWLPALLLWGACLGFDKLVFRLTEKNARLDLLPTALCLTLLAVLLTDNFSYTVFRIGIIHAQGISRYLYLLLVLAAFVAIFLQTVKVAKRYGFFFRRPAAFYLVGLPLSAAVFIFVGKLFSPSVGGPVTESGRGASSSLPNIIFFASDGIDANRLALYGYRRNTTPRLNLFAKSRPPLLCENAFSNGARTTGSVTSMLTGKAPATNKVFFPPHVLQNADSLRHLPGILKHLGYENFQETIRYYADAGDLNLQGAFDVANNRVLARPGMLGRRFTSENYFLTAFADRLGQRALHLLGIRRMEDVHAQMTRSDKPNEVYGTNDDTRMDRFLKFVSEAKAPFFAHLHLLDSHCCTYKIRRPFFSARGEDDDEPTAGDLMDDTILSSDYHFGRMVDFLSQRGLLANTLIVYSSDHNRGWTIKKRIPLVFFFPEGKRARAEEKNCQLLDVMPTILDSLGRTVPPWVEGNSLLRGDKLESTRPIFGFLNINRRPIKIGASTVTTLTDAGPPFYGLSSYAMVSCDRWYELNLNNGKISSGKVAGHSGECEEDEELDAAQAKRKIIGHLRSRNLGFRFKDAG